MIAFRKSFAGIVLVFLLGIGVGFGLEKYRHSLALKNSGVLVPPPLELQRIYESAPPRAAQIIVVGDSIVQFCPWSEYLENEVLSLGIMGESTEQLRGRLAELKRHHSEVAIVISGANDVKSHLSESRTLENLAYICDSGIAKNYILVGVLPMKAEFATPDSIRDLNSGIESLTRRTGSHFLAPPKDYTSQDDTFDGLHPSGTGYRKLARDLKLALQNLHLDGVH